MWGREWCLEKGFGLGVSETSIWSRTDKLDNVKVNAFSNIVLEDVTVKQ